MLPEEEVELADVVLHVTEVVEEDFKQGVIHCFGFVDPALGGKLLIQT
jgi:hypothetical protein